ncbi:hypothetical protein C8Q79DRAFT_1039930 [Trametes meyenii]|nr:hypothetical protein C8Q79DRAFT_1039930 [Trametes meyenii]
MANVNTCRILRDWFERNPDNHLFLHYCPSHCGIEENEAVDLDVKHAAREGPERGIRYGRGGFPQSYALIKHSITDSLVNTEWAELAEKKPREYWGRYYPKHPAFRSLRHSGNFPLKRLGGRPTLAARFIRCITDHGPTGRYRDRFRGRHREPTFCALHSGRPAYQTREHILFRCDHYTRQYRYSSIEDLLTSLDPFYDIQRFLEDNPSAMTFDDLP